MRTSALSLLALSLLPLALALGTRPLSHAAVRNPLHALAARQVGICTTSCASASDQASLNLVTACSTTDATCVCTNAFNLSAGCLTCVLTAEDLTPTELQAACSGSSTSATPSAQTAGQGGSTVAALPSQTAGSATGAPICSNECSSSSDLAGVNSILQCSQTDTACLCTSASTLSSLCLSCVLAADDLTTSQYSTDCAAAGSSPSAPVSNSGSGTAGPTGSGTVGSLPSTTGKSAGESLGAGVAFGVVALLGMAVLA